MSILHKTSLPPPADDEEGRGRREGADGDRDGRGALGAQPRADGSNTGAHDPGRGGAALQASFTHLGIGWHLIYPAFLWLKFVI